MSRHDRVLLLQDDTRLGFRALDFPSLVHGVFSRHGGRSPAPWNSNNVSFGLGDADENVLANRQKIKNNLECNYLVSARQVHGDRVCCISDPPGHDLEVDGYDALVTTIRGVGLMIQQADCQAVMLFDSENKAVGIAHVGWRGSAAGIIVKTVAAMVRSFTTEPRRLIATVSPSLGPCCAEFVNYRTELPVSLHGYQVRPNYFDFWAISRDQLQDAGVEPKNIHIAGICTRCSPDYFSYRREKQTGRFASVIGMR